MPGFPQGIPIPEIEFFEFKEAFKGTIFSRVVTSIHKSIFDRTTHLNKDQGFFFRIFILWRELLTRTILLHPLLTLARTH